ncbi:MAG: T9SS type A sorting domain-containing protein [Ignavibacteria bacterium]
MSNESMLFIGTNNGVYYSTDDGKHWNTKKTVLKNKVVNTLVKFKNAIIAGTNSYGFFASFNNGETWDDLNINLSPSTVYSVTVQDSILFARTRGGKVYRLKDIQSDWELIDYNVFSTTCIKVYKNNLYTISINRRLISDRQETYDSYLHVSSDYGETWDSVGNVFKNVTFNSLFVNDSIMILIGGTGGIHTSSDQGKTWSTKKNGIFYYITEGIYSFNDRIYCNEYNGIFWDFEKNINWETIDNHTGWKSLGINRDLNVITLFHNNGNLFAGTSRSDNSLGGVYQLNSETDSLIEMSNGLTATYASIVAADDNFLIAKNRYRYMVYTDNNGNSWKNIQCSNIEDIDTYRYYITMVSLNNSQLYLGIYGDLGRNFNGIYYSSNFGEFWNFIHASNLPWGVNSIAFIDSLIFASGTNKIFVSKDKGISWENVNGQISTAVHWLEVRNGVLVASSAQGIFYSTDYGVTWIASGGGNIGDDVWSHTQDDNYFYVGSYDNGIFVSIDDGRNWESFNIGLENRYISDITSGGGYVFALTDNGIYFSKTNINNWQQFSYEDGPTEISSLQTNRTYLFAGTANSGVFRFPISQITSTNSVEEKVISDFFLSQNYPNPFNPTTKIDFEIASSSFTTLKIYDILGKEVATLVEGVLPPGHYSKKWNATKNSSGIYLYTLKSGSFLETKKLLLIK